jgi:predicted GNAT family acetyltransferase
MAIEVVDVPGRHRFEARDGDEVVGELVYRLASDGAVRLIHTEVSREGAGVGSALARTALDSWLERGATVRVECPFVVGWVERHPRYRDQVVLPQAEDPGDQQDDADTDGGRGTE